MPKTPSFKILNNFHLTPHLFASVAEYEELNKCVGDMLKTSNFIDKPIVTNNSLVSS